MDDLRTRATLVAYDRAGTAAGTVLTRAEIAEAASGTEFPATLRLDLDKVEAADGHEVTAHASVAVDWDQETLEQLLASTDAQEIELWFDERDLARAFDDGDVEGHGLRERAAVLAVAVVAAGASTTPALARVAADTGGAGTGAATTGFSVNPATGARSVPIGGAERALQQDEKLSQGMGGGGFSVNPQAVGHGATVQPAGAERGLLQDEKLAVTHDQGTGASAVTSSSSGTLSSSELAAVVAGGALLITAAGFGASRRRTPPALPA